MSAGRLYEKVSFQKRIEVNPDAPRDLGNIQSVWETQFERRAAYRHLRGGETVLAARLSGVHPQVITVRAGDDTRTVNPDWRIVDNRTGTVYNIRDVSPSVDDRMWLDILADTGAAT